MARKIRMMLSVTAIFLGAGLALAQSAEETARDRAESWLQMLDQEKYAESFKEQSSGKLTESQWVESIRKIRQALGNLESRILKSATLATAPEGAPSGQYAIVEFDSKFSAEAVVERVGIVRGSDGAWSVYEYRMADAT